MQIFRLSRARGGLAAAFMGAVLTCCAALRASHAQEAAETPWIPSPSIATSLPDNGDPGGLRSYLGERGFAYQLTYSSEGTANVKGGLRRGEAFQGKLETAVTADFEKMLGLSGLSGFANVFQLHRTAGTSRDIVGNMITISNIEALPTTRLSELWLEQKFLGDKVSLRAGQLAADAEFFISDYSTMFMNSDWPTITKRNLPSGAASYPLTTPGIRLKIQPSKELSFLAALFNGDPAGPGPEQPEHKNRHGLNFRTSDPPLLLVETQHRSNQDPSDAGLASILRLGAWHHFGRFDDLRYDAQGLSLANPLSTGLPARLKGTSGIYGVIDQQIYRPEGGGPDSGISVFSRVGASPSDRNLINYYLDGGIVFAGMIPGRPADRFGATFIFANVSGAARGLDRDTIFFTGELQPVRSFEMTVAVAYQAQIVPGWTIQPEFHRVINPGGHISHPDHPETAIKNASVFAVRSVIRY